MYFLIFTLLCSTYYFNYKKKKKNIPKGFNNKCKFDKKVEHVSEINRDGYSKKKIPENLDAIVIGSGIGGLTTAALLSRIGKKVLVLEQHYIAGGCTHCFEDEGYEFDTGIHYIGNVEKRQELLNMITEHPIEWDKMGREDGKYVYDEIRIGELEHDYRAGESNFIHDLIEKFPKEEEAIKKYVSLVKKTARKDLYFMLKIMKPVWLRNLILKFFCNDFFNIVTQTPYEVLRKLTKNEELIAILCGQYGDCGPLPSEGSFFMHAGVVNHYLNGGWYPRGGCNVIANNIIPVIEKSGGRVLVRQGVKQILVKNNKAYGVELMNGNIIKSKIVISNAGALNTYTKLLPQKLVPNHIFENMSQLGRSCCFIYLFVGMDTNYKNLNLRSSNMWSYPDKDFDKMLKKYYDDPLNEPMPFFMGFPCMKDSTWNNRYPDKSNAVILTAAKYEWFEQWENYKWEKRGEDYKEFKKKFGDKLLKESLFKHYPQCKEHVNYVKVGSPLTFNHFIGSTRGEVYGLDCLPERFSRNDWLTPETHIKDLYMTGQDITTLGFSGALMSGVLTAHAILKYGTISDILLGRDLIKDLRNI